MPEVLLRYCMCCLLRREGGAVPGSLVLTVASSDGMLYCYTVEGVAGGTGSTPKYFLQAEWRLRPSEANH
mgnify:CR=1 FL=1